MTLRVQDIHAQVGRTWPALLAQLGIPEERLQKKAGPCPACGGTDRFTFDNRRNKGDFLCRQCGAGSGFDLLMRTFKIDFREARRRVIEAAGLDDDPELDGCHNQHPLPRAQPSQVVASAASPPERVRRLLRECCELADCDDVFEYLLSRKVLPLPPTCTLKAHPTVQYFHDRVSVGRFAALVAPVRDISGDLVTVHVTYLHNGGKLIGHEPRKILAPLIGRTGCAVRLFPVAGDTLGIAEGIETAIAAQLVTGVTTWAALNTSLLGKFEPPPNVRKLVVFADRDIPGLEAAGRLMERLQGRLALELRPPRAPAKDWNDVVIAERAA